MSYRDSLGEYAILKRITGLKHVQFKSRPAKFSTTTEAYARKDQNADGEFVEEFSNNVIPGAVTGLAPIYNEIKDTYWAESKKLLTEIASEIKVSYPNNHPSKPGGLILPSEIDPGDYWDPFFTSDKLQKKQMESGTYTFNLQKDHIDALLFYCYKNNPETIVRDGNDQISKYVIGKARFELIIPSHEKVQDRNKLSLEVDALSLLKGLDYDKQRKVAKILRLKFNDYENPNPDSLYLRLGDFAKNTEKIPRLGITKQEKFINLAQSSNEDLMVHLDIVEGSDLRLITTERGNYMLNSEKLEGVSNEYDLYDFFKDDKNIEKYRDLSFLISEKKNTG
jgi:hypothetical protein